MKNFILSLAALVVLAACSRGSYPSRLEAYVARYVDGCDTSEFTNHFSAKFEKYVMDFVSCPDSLADLVFECPEPYKVVIRNGFLKYDVSLIFYVPESLLNHRFRIIGFSAVVPISDESPAVRYFPSDRGVLLGSFEFKDLKTEIIE